MNTNNVEHLEAWCDTLLALAHIYRKPTATTRDIALGLEEALASAGVPLSNGSSLESSLKATDETELIRDYSRLFVGPFELMAAPFGSIYLEDGRQIMGKSTYDALKFYQNAGLDISADDKNPPDHFVVEVEFLYYLLFKQIEAIRNGDTEGEQAARDQFKAFLSTHTAQWVSAFTDAIKENAETEFYQALGQTTKTIGEALKHDLLQ